jgi:hypothetical protein
MCINFSSLGQCVVGSSLKSSIASAVWNESTNVSVGVITQLNFSHFYETDYSFKKLTP